MIRLPNLGNIMRQVAYSPNSSNFNDWVRYARGAMNTGQTPSATGYRDYLGPQATQAPPGGAKNQQTPPPPTPVSNIGQLQQMPMPQTTTPAPSGPPPKARNLQYAAALSRMK